MTATIRRSPGHLQGSEVARLWHGDGMSAYQREVQVPGFRVVTWRYLLRAGDENRTRTTSLEGWGSTIELHPQGTSAATDAEVMMPRSHSGRPHRIGASTGHVVH